MSCVLPLCPTVATHGIEVHVLTIILGLVSHASPSYSRARDYIRPLLVVKINVFLVTSELTKACGQAVVIIPLFYLNINFPVQFEHFLSTLKTGC